MEIPTVLVKRKADGHVCTINESDFDPNLHEKAKADKKVEPKAEAKEPEPEAPAPRRRRRG